MLRSKKLQVFQHVEPHRLCSLKKLKKYCDDGGVYVCNKWQWSPDTPKIDQQAMFFDRNVRGGFGDGQGRINAPQVPRLKVVCPEQIPPFYVNSSCLATA